MLMLMLGIACMDKYAICIRLKAKAADASGDDDDDDENDDTAPLQMGQQLPSSVIWSASRQVNLGQSSSGTNVSHSTEPSLQPLLSCFLFCKEIFLHYYFTCWWF